MRDIGSANGEEESGGSAVGEVCRPHLTEKSLLDYLLYSISNAFQSKCMVFFKHDLTLFFRFSFSFEVSAFSFG